MTENRRYFCPKELDIDPSTTGFVEVIEKPHSWEPVFYDQRGTEIARRGTFAQILAAVHAGTWHEVNGEYAWGITGKSPPAPVVSWDQPQTQGDAW